MKRPHFISIFPIAFTNSDDIGKCKVFQTWKRIGVKIHEPEKKLACNQEESERKMKTVTLQWQITNALR